MVYYNISNITEGEGNVMLNLVRVTSEQTHYLVGLLLLLSVFIILFYSLYARGYTFIASATACLFVNMILAIMMYALGAVGGVVLITSIILLPLSIFMLFVSSG